MRKRKQNDTKELVKKINFHKEEISKHRDALREILEDVETFCGSVDEAVDELEAAVDALSQHL